MSFTRDEKVHFQSDQVSAIEEAFATFDFNNDGLISLQEFRQILKSLGENVTDKEIQEKLKEWDNDGDGNINFSEFLYAMTRILTDINNEERLKEAFKLFDKDNNGYITPFELSNVLSKLGQNVNPEEVLEMITEADMDNDGKISFSEFKKLMST